MPTFLFDEIIFGPVKSRRLGISLGINLLPVNRKLCNFDCIYCECGWSHTGTKIKSNLPSASKVAEALVHKLSEMKDKGIAPDVITYAGNGEPTLHPEFCRIIDDSIEIRDRYFPEARIAVLSNSTTISKKEIREALLKVDQNILKLDSAIASTIELINKSSVAIDIQDLIRNLEAFNGKVIIQTLFVRGTYDGKIVDNTTDGEIDEWLSALKKIRPSEVMIYTISRDTPLGDKLRKVPAAELDRIAALVNSIGIKTQVSG